MKPVSILMILAGTLLLAGCSGTHSSSAKTSTGKTSVTAAPAHADCICGTHEAKLHGCPAPECVSGAGNPDNPKCTCAPLKPVTTPAKGK